MTFRLVTSVTSNLFYFSPQYLETYRSSSSQLETELGAFETFKKVVIIFFILFSGLTSLLFKGLFFNQYVF